MTMAAGKSWRVPELFDEGVLNQLHTPVKDALWQLLQPLGEFGNAYYGTGWRIFDLSGLRVVHHGGGVRVIGQRWRSQTRQILVWLYSLMLKPALLMK